MKNEWQFSIGFYPGILMGFRSYEEKQVSNHVLYIPFVDFCWTKYKI